MARRLKVSILSAKGGMDKPIVASKSGRRLQETGATESALGSATLDLWLAMALETVLH